MIGSGPAVAASSDYTSTCISALRPGGRAVLNGGRHDNVSLPYLEMMIKSLTVCGQYMYSRGDILQLIRMAESGLLPLGRKAGVQTVGRFGLEQFQEALDLAEEEAGWGKQVVIAP
jgi:threonine dehydrogenase-like Zn-dependent dehydrogenase